MYCTIETHVDDLHKLRGHVAVTLARIGILIWFFCSHTQPRRESSIKADTSVPSSNHAVPVNHTRILSRFFLSSLNQTITGSAGHMKLKVTKASAAADNRLNKLRTIIPHSLYDDPAFSADPSSNPLCSASHDINNWITDPPKGHPTINTLPDQSNSFSFRKVTPVPPPNSPVSLHDRQQVPVSMTRPVSIPNVTPTSTSLPDLSLTGSSASDLSLKTTGASRSSLNISQTSASSGENKKRIGLSFFKRRSNPEGVPPHRLVKHTKAMSLNSTTGSKHTKPDSHSPSVMNGPSEVMMGTINGKKPTVLTAQSARALDMIDELDESNPLGIPLHHGGPYEAIQKIVGSNPNGRPRASRLEQQQSSLHSHPFRFDVPLNLSPGQVLPHSVTAYYRPQVPMDSAISFRDRLGLQPTISNQPVDQVSRPAMNWNAMNQPGMAHSAMNVKPTHTSHPSMHAPPSNPALEQSFPLYRQPTDQTQPINGRIRVRDAQVLSGGEPRMTPPVDGMGHLTIDGGFAADPASVDPDACEFGKVIEESDDRTQIGEQLMTGECQDTDDEDQGAFDSVPDDPIAHDIPREHGDTRLHYLEDAKAQSRFPPHESSRNTPPPPPYGLSRNTPPPPHGPSGNIVPIPYGPPRNTPPPPNMFLSPPAPHDPYRRQELPPGPFDHRVYEVNSSAPSSSSSIRSGAASAMTGFTGLSSATSNFRNRILPRQLVMPAPLAKAAASSRPQPTHLPQSAQVLRNVQRQHHIRFDDGAEYDLPVTTSTQTNPNWTPSSVETPSARPAETQTRTPSIMRSKLKKQKSLRGPEPPEIVARLAAAPQVRPRRKYMEPPPKIGRAHV